MRVDQITKIGVPEIMMAENETVALQKLDEMIADLEGVGLSELESYWTQRYNKNVERFGFKFY